MASSSVGSVSMQEDNEYSFTLEEDYAEDCASSVDSWADASHLSADARLWVRTMIRKMPEKLLHHLTRFARKSVYSSILNLLAGRICSDEQRSQPLTPPETVYVLAVGTTQIYKSLLPSAASLTGE